MARNTGPDPMDNRVNRPRPSGRQILWGVVAAVLLVFIFTNWETITVNLFTATIEMPLWLILGITAGIGFVLGSFTGSRRAKANMPRK